jgi:hypothetical protein
MRAFYVELGNGGGQSVFVVSPLAIVAMFFQVSTFT